MASNAGTAPNYLVPWPMDVSIIGEWAFWVMSFLGVLGRGKRARSLVVVNRRVYAAKARARRPLPAPPLSISGVVWGLNVMGRLRAFVAGGPGLLGVEAGGVYGTWLRKPVGRARARGKGVSRIIQDYRISPGGDGPIGPEPFRAPEPLPPAVVGFGGWFVGFWFCGSRGKKGRAAGCSYAAAHRSGVMPFGRPGPPAFRPGVPLYGRLFYAFTRRLYQTINAKPLWRGRSLGKVQRYPSPDSS